MIRLRSLKEYLFIIILVSSILSSLFVPQTNAMAVMAQTVGASAGGTVVSAVFGTQTTPGDLLIAVCSGNVSEAITPPSGFTEAVYQTTTASQGIYYKISDGTESSISCITGTSAGQMIQIYEYRGIENVNPLDAVNTTESLGSGTTASTGTVTTKNYNDLIFGAIVSDSATLISSSWSNSFIEENSGVSNSKRAYDGAYASGDNQVSAPGSYSSSTTVGNASWRGQIAAFKIAPNPVFSGDIVDSSGASVANPSISMSPTTESFQCQTSTGTLGSSSQKIRITNTTPTDKNGWNLTISPTSNNWNDGHGHSYSYDNSSGSPAGCAAGQLTINPTTTIITPETAPESGCTTTGLSTAASSAFTSTSAATLLTANASSSYYCYWDITGIGLAQTIPPSQVGGSYSLNLTLTLTAL